MRNLLFVCLLVSLSAHILSAQIYYVDGRTVCCGDIVNNLNNNSGIINPANLGAVQVKSSSFNLFQVGFDSYSNTLNRSDTWKMFLPFSNDSLSQGGRQQIVDNLLSNNGQLKLNGNMNINWISMSWTRPQFGGLAVSLNERINSFIDLQPKIGTAVMTGSNYVNYQVGQDTLQNSRVRYSHLREASVSYGRQAANTDKLKIYAGANFRYVWGIGFLNLDVQDSTATGNTAFSNFYNLDYGNLDTLFSNIKNIFGNAGKGYSFSAGFNMNWKDRWYLGASALGIGKMRWNKNVLETQNSTVNYPTDTTNTGAPSYQMQQNVGNLMDMFDFTPPEDTTTVVNLKTPSNLRIDVSYRIIDQLKVYTDILLPLNPEISGLTPNYIFGLDYGIIPEAFYVSGGIQLNKTFGTRFPFGTSFALSERGFISISTGDLPTLLNGKIKEPYAAISISLIAANVGGSPTQSYPPPPVP